MILRKLSQVIGGIKKGWAVDTFLGGFPVFQALQDPDNASTTAIHAAISLTTAVQNVTTGITDPDVYRCLSITGNEADMNQDVTIVGHNWAGNTIEETITLSGTNTVVGLMPFKDVTKIVAPVQLDAGETVAIGHANKFGLYRPLFNDATASVVRFEQGVTAESATVDATYDTVIPTTTPDGSKDFSINYLTDMF